MGSRHGWGHSRLRDEWTGVLRVRREDIRDITELVTRQQGGHPGVSRGVEGQWESEQPCMRRAVPGLGQIPYLYTGDGGGFAELTMRINKDCSGSTQHCLTDSEVENRNELLFCLVEVSLVFFLQLIQVFLMPGQSQNVAEPSKCPCPCFKVNLFLWALLV